MLSSFFVWVILTWDNGKKGKVDKELKVSFNIKKWRKTWLSTEINVMLTDKMCTN